MCGWRHDLSYMTGRDEKFAIYPRPKNKSTKKCSILCKEHVWIQSKFDLITNHERWKLRLMRPCFAQILRHCKMHSHEEEEKREKENFVRLYAFCRKCSVFSAVSPILFFNLFTVHPFWAWTSLPSRPHKKVTI